MLKTAILVVLVLLHPQPPPVRGHHHAQACLLVIRYKVSQTSKKCGFECQTDVQFLPCLPHK